MKTQKQQVLDILRDEVFVPDHMQEAARISKLAEIVIKLAEQIDILQSESRKGLPDSINEALNSGDGVYRP